MPAEAHGPSVLMRCAGPCQRRATTPKASATDIKIKRVLAFSDLRASLPVRRRAISTCAPMRTTPATKIGSAGLLRVSTSTTASPIPTIPSPQRSGGVVTLPVGRKRRSFQHQIESTSVMTTIDAIHGRNICPAKTWLRT